MQMFEFLGVLFGCCIRTGVRIALDLPAFVWKPLVGDQLTRADLAAVNVHAVETLKLIESFDEETFEATINQTFTTELSDKSVVELKENGANIRVTYADRHEYVALALAARLSEHKQQIEAIRRGIGQLVPLQLLNLLAWNDLEVLICGRTYIDIELLRRHTKYADGISPESQHIEMFWDVLNSFDQETRRLFIRFAWAQDRLPADDAEFERLHTRLMIKPSSSSDPDGALPRSDTCFFNLELPAYTNEATMRAKLLYAISSTMTMNADEEGADLHGARGNDGRFGRRGFGDEDSDY